MWNKYISKAQKVMHIDTLFAIIFHCAHKITARRFIGIQYGYELTEENLFHTTRKADILNLNIHISLEWKYC